LSESAPEYNFNRLAVDSAMPSISPIKAVPTPKTLLKKSGIRLAIISEEISVRNDVAVSTQTFRGNCNFFMGHL